ncbi:MAG: hypothetical protein IPO21_03350 [Bacteroidales bacterium]|nr:hypothetical protein [Bacteroidales bacterium]
MGFEYKIKTTITACQTKDIHVLLEQNVYFERKYHFDNNEFWDFRHPENPGKIPNATIIFEPDGIYICQYGSSFLWTYFDALKNYLDIEKIEFKILDYSD